MRLHVRLIRLFGGLLIFMALTLGVFLLRDVRRAFIQRNAEHASHLAELAIEQCNRRAKLLTDAVEDLSQDIQLQILMRDATNGGASQRKLIDLCANRMASSGLQELTAISPEGIVLARGHHTADFGDRILSTETSPAPGNIYLQPESNILRFCQPVLIQNRQVGKIEGGLDLSDVLSEMGTLFSGEVALDSIMIPDSSRVRQPNPDAVFQDGFNSPFRYTVSKPWTLSDGTLLTQLVFSRTDEDSRRMVQHLIIRTGSLVLLVLAGGAFIVTRLSKAVTRPIQQLALAASEISRGSRHLNLPPPSHDEVGELTEAFSRMAASLDESQKKLLAAERLAAWQDAARMLAHEIKNPLSPIKTTASTLARAAQEKDAHLDKLAGRGAATILNEIAHLEKLLSEFSSFARFPSPKPSPADFNSAVRQTVESLRDKAKEIRFVERYAGNLPPAMIDPGMFSEVVRNLILNAVDAVGSAPARVIHIETSRENTHVVLTLADSGLGIPADKRRTLFTPYFTTKPGGTGLGLAVSRKIMIEHGGDLTLLDASPFADAAGAAFRAKLPLATLPAK